MQVTCPSCQSQIPSDDMNLTNMVAKCRQCNDLIDLHQFIFTDDTVQNILAPKERVRVPVPTGYTVDDSGSGLKIVYRWLCWDLFFAVPICVAWDSLVAVFYAAIFLGNTPWWVMVIFVLFTSAHLAIGIWMTYSALAHLVNRTTFHVDQEMLVVSRGPLPWRGNRALPIDNLDQIYSQVEAHRGKRGDVSYTYNLCAATKDGHKVVLDVGLEMDEALFIEQCVETYLGIKDQPVTGEVVR